MGAIEGVMKPLKRLPPPETEFSTFDIETEKGTWDSFAFLGSYDGADYNVYDSPEEYLSDLVAAGRERTIYAHYLDFDMMFLYDALRETDYPCQIRMTDSMTLGVDVFAKGAKLHFRNSYSVLPHSLGKLFEAFLGVKKESLENLGKRNYEDCAYLHRIIGMYYGIVGTSGMTTSQITMGYFRHKFQKFPIENNWRLDRVVRESYYGGRTEIFKYNLDSERKVNLYDINSMYPYVMKENPYPVGEMLKTHAHEQDSLGVCMCVVDDLSALPSCPERIGNRTMFLNRRKKVWITTAQYEYLREHGMNAQFLFGYETSKVDWIFKDFVTELYGKRQHAIEDGNGVLDVTYKLLMNSLYGKFGQRTEHSCYFMNMKDAAGALPVSMDGSVTCSHENKRNAFVNPMLSSLTTDYARNRLRDYAGRVEQDDLLYCDTDSIYTFSGRIENSKQLGMMKLEKSVTPFYLVKPKFYIAGDVKKGKGVPKEDMSFRNFLAFLKGGEIVSRRGIVKFKSGVRNTDLGGTMVKAKVLKKSMRTPYDKRIIKGLETKPFSVRMQPHLYPEVNRREFSKYVRELIPKVALLVGSDEKKKD